MSPCTVCHDHPGQPQLCLACAGEVANALAELPDLLALAEPWLAADIMRATGSPTGPTVTKDPPPPCDLDLLDAGNPRSLLGELAEWADDWRHTFQLADNTRANLARNIAHTQAHLTAFDRATRYQRRPWIIWLDADQAARLAATVRGRRDQLERQLAHLNRQARDLDTHEPNPAATITTVIQFLATWWPVAATDHPDANLFARQVLQCHRRALGAMRIDGLDTADGITITCPADIVVTETTDDGTATQTVRVCAHQLRITRHTVWATHPSPTGEWPDRITLGRVTCPRCHTDWSPDRLLAVWRTTGQGGCWLDADLVAQQLGATVKDLDRLQRAGRVQRRYNQWRITQGATA